MPEKKRKPATEPPETGLRRTTIELIITTTPKKSQLPCSGKMPRLNPLAVIALRRYLEELTRLEITRENSSLADCCNEILAANEVPRHG